MAFDLIMKFEFVEPGSVTFKYKKDTVHERFTNGEFKFVLDDWVLFSDADPSRNGWFT